MELQGFVVYRVKQWLKQRSELPIQESIAVLAEQIVEDAQFCLAYSAGKAHRRRYQIPESPDLNTEWIALPTTLSYEEFVEQARRRYLVRALGIANGNITKAARLSGAKRTTILAAVAKRFDPVDQ